LRHQLMAIAASWSKPVLAQYDDGEGALRPLVDGQAAPSTRLRFALQMSNRAGCVEQRQLEAFRDAVLEWAAANDGNANCPDVAEAHAMAQELDRFCADVDIAVGVNVVTNDSSPFSGTKIRGLAESAGLRLEADGVFYCRSDEGQKRYTLDNHEPMPFVPEQMKTLFTRGVTFLLDVPRVQDPLAAFDAMLETARNFSNVLDGTLVDDNRATLTAEAVGKIRRQLESIVVRMEAGQIPAGGPRALRLFS
jgi:FtsZ-interacting cell division protein ZipA